MITRDVWKKRFADYFFDTAGLDRNNSVHISIIENELEIIFSHETLWEKWLPEHVALECIHLWD